ncbi:coiled-coil domain-containing protein 157 [Labrus bergylta]|uniref:coiled-coil domain-containing protein 157 n=1 Tax=Labrus bergylta TaxID=56723 RepID=UPI0009B34D3B|nr:general vesicular transport factor p115-like [Labrus bergylta]
MSWDRQVSSLLSVTDGSVAKMRERLGSGGEDLFPSKETIIDSDPDPPIPPSRCQLQRERPLSDSIQWSDLAALQSQLRIQRQEIQSLTQRVITMETERYSQRSLIQKLQEEVQRLGNRRGEEWRTEVVCELSSLRGQLTGATFLGNLEDSLSSKLQHQRRDIDLVKTQLRVQEEELLHLQKETRESRRQGQHTCRTVEQMTESFRSHSCDMTKTLSDTQREVQQIRSTVSQLKEEIRTLREPLLSAHTPGASPLLSLPRRGLRPEVDSDMDSDDLSLTASLDEVSSDDLSWTDHRDPTDLHRKHLRDQSGPSHRSIADPHLQDEKEDDDNDEDNDNDDDDNDDNIVNLDVVSDLSLNDL